MNRFGDPRYFNSRYSKLTDETINTGINDLIKKTEDKYNVGMEKLILEQGRRKIANLNLKYDSNNIGNMKGSGKKNLVLNKIGKLGNDEIALQVKKENKPTYDKSYPNVGRQQFMSPSGMNYDEKIKKLRPLTNDELKAISGTYEQLSLEDKNKAYATLLKRSSKVRSMTLEALRPALRAPTPEESVAMKVNPRETSYIVKGTSIVDNKVVETQTEKFAKLSEMPIGQPGKAVNPTPIEVIKSPNPDPVDSVNIDDLKEGETPRGYTNNTLFNKIGDYMVSGKQAPLGIPAEGGGYSMGKEGSRGGFSIARGATIYNEANTNSYLIIGGNAVLIAIMAFKK